VAEFVVKEQDFLAARPEYTSARAVIFGAPLDITVCFRSGTRGGPAAVRAMSYCLEEYSLDQGRDLRSVAFHDLGDVLLPPGAIQESLARIEAVTECVCGDGKVPVVFGGEHLITWPVVRAIAARHSGLALVHLDAHADLRAEYLGVAFSHATVMRRIGELLGPENLFHFGIRSADRSEMEVARRSGAFHLHRILPGLVEALAVLRNRPVYVSLDMDVVDPAFAPGVGTPEPAGVTPQELLDAVRLLRGLSIVGLDVVEVNPVYDPSGITALLAAKFIREMLVGLVCD